MDKIKILYLIDKLTPAGTQTNLLELVRGLNRDYYEPHVVVISDAQAMNVESSNALLKSLEEPPPRTFFFSHCGPDVGPPVNSGFPLSAHPV